MPHREEDLGGDMWGRGQWLWLTVESDPLLMIAVCLLSGVLSPAVLTGFTYSEP